MQQQLPQVAHFTRRHPDPRKPPFHQQLQNMRRIALVRLLLPHVAGTNLRRIAHPQLVTQLAQQIHQPVTVAGGFHADQRRRRYLPVEPFRVARGLYQLPLPGLSRIRIQPTHLLPTGMKITSYNHHVRRLLSAQQFCFLTKSILSSNRAFALIQSILAPLFLERVRSRVLMQRRVSFSSPVPLKDNNCLASAESIDLNRDRLVESYLSKKPTVTNQPNNNATWNFSR